MAGQVANNRELSQCTFFKELEHLLACTISIGGRSADGTVDLGLFRRTATNEGSTLGQRGLGCDGERSRKFGLVGSLLLGTDFRNFEGGRVDDEEFVQCFNVVSVFSRVGEVVGGRH